MAATLAAAQKLASSEDTAQAEDDEDADKVWLRAQTPGGGVGGTADERSTCIMPSQQGGILFYREKTWARAPS